MEPFEFHPELFELRNSVLELLADHGFAWLSDFGSVDLLHDVYGVEVCGIRQESDAHAIGDLLRELFPSWRYSARCISKDSSTREPGRKVTISRDPPRTSGKGGSATRKRFQAMGPGHDWFGAASGIRATGCRARSTSSADTPCRRSTLRAASISACGVFSTAVALGQPPERPGGRRRRRRRSREPPPRWIRSLKIDLLAKLFRRGVGAPAGGTALPDVAPGSALDVLRPRAALTRPFSLASFPHAAQPRIEAGRELGDEPFRDDRRTRSIRRPASGVQSGPSISASSSASRIIRHWTTPTTPTGIKARQGPPPRALGPIEPSGDGQTWRLDSYVGHRGLLETKPAVRDAFTSSTRPRRNLADTRATNSRARFHTG